MDVEKHIPQQVETDDDPNQKLDTPAALINSSSDHYTYSKEERRLLWKADLAIVPVIAVAYLVMYLDRGGIGNARIMGLTKDLHLSPSQFFNCLTVFFVGYTIAMAPANLSARHLKPNRSIGTAVIFFGLICACMAAVTSYGALLSLRIFLGVGQGFLQVAPVYASLWYRRDEVATRSAIYYACATIAGAFGGLIAYGVQKNLTMAATGRAPWSWLFLIEGVIAMAVGLVVIAVLPRFPDDLKQRQMQGKRHWLFTDEEVDLAYRRYIAFNVEGEKFQWKYVWAAFKDIKTLFFGLIQGAAVLGISVVTSFLPTFFSEFGFDPLKTQLYTVIPYALAFVMVILFGYLSDRTNLKSPFILFSCLVGILGHVLLLTITATTGKVVAACLITAACYPVGILLPVWLAINTPHFSKRGTAWAASEVFGTGFAIMGTRIFNTPPRFFKGYSVVLAFWVVGAVCTIANAWYMHRANKKKDRILEEYDRRGETHPHVSERRTLGELHDEHISFRYVL